MSIKKDISNNKKFKSEMNALIEKYGVKVYRLSDYDGEENWCGDRFVVKIGDTFFDEIQEHFKIING